MPMRDLPSVDRLVRSIESSLPRALLTEIARAAIDAAREEIGAGGDMDPSTRALESVRSLEAARLRGVINATGVLLHTNLGRAPLPHAAAEAARQAATGYGNLEFDTETGKRGSRAGYLTRLLATVTGAEAAVVLNNNAGALFLALMALGHGREVPVSRGELIEIGGSYRLPELMAASGVRLVEVGTTNRTRVSDYRVANDPALVLKVHPSNYRVSGFTEEANLEELAGLARELSVPLVFDAGSGLIDSTCPWVAGPPPAWVLGEPGVVQALAAGADLVMFSGDKLYGGPQAGIVVGSAELVGRLKSHPVARALRVDGPTIAALTAVTEAYASGAAGTLPFWRMALASVDDLQRRSDALIEAAGAGVIVESGSTPGAGSVPGASIPGPAIAFEDGRMFERLIGGDPPVIGRREEGRLLIDLRSVDPSDDASVAAAVVAACR